MKIQPESLSLHPPTSPRRWIWALLFLAITIHYIDRQVLPFLALQLQTEIGWSEIEYGYIVTAFQFLYAVGEFDTVKS